MRGKMLTIPVCAAVLCLGLQRQAEAQRRGGGFASRVGSVRLATVRYDDDEAWNAGFGAHTPAYPTAPRDVATVSPSSSAWRPWPSQNRVDSLAPSTFGYGSIQNAGGSLLQPAPAAPISAGEGNPVWLLVRMGDYLAKQQQLTMWIRQTSDRVNESGQKVQLVSEQVTYVQRPDRLAVEVSAGDARTRIVYDGTGVTVLETTRNLYGTIPLQGTLDQVLDTLAKRYGMAVPADDLLYNGSFARLEKKIRSAHDLGTEDLDGQPCQHAAFSGTAVDFQLWLESGSQPIPRKVIIDYKTVPERPRCTLEITRFETGAIPASVFKVDVPANARQIRILPHQ